MKNVVSAGGIVIINDRLLLVRLDSGKYAIPKGHKKAGESDAETAIREVEEETGIKTHVISLLGEYTRPSTENDGSKVSKKIVVYLLSQTGLSSMLPDEMSLWVNIDDAIYNMRYSKEADFIKLLKTQNFHL
ncbi:MAG: NUDIX domain-containing protein [Patescibacteria group bacterium]|jgi:diadenosine hexaphosphate hydrolase (ATP-forming)|nr:NUDIX domain-containing protein [Patescibacteria group bacterium]